MRDRGYMGKVPEKEQDPTKKNQWYITHDGVHCKNGGHCEKKVECELSSTLPYSTKGISSMNWHGMCLIWRDLELIP